MQKTQNTNTQTNTNGAQINGAQINGAQINGAQINGVSVSPIARAYYDLQPTAHTFTKAQIIDLINASIEREEKNNNTTKQEYLKNLKSFIYNLNINLYVVRNSQTQTLNITPSSALNIGYLIEYILLCYYFNVVSEGVDYEIKGLCINPVNPIKHNCKRAFILSVQPKLLGLYKIAQPQQINGVRMTSAKAFIKVSEKIGLEKTSNFKDLINEINNNIKNNTFNKKVI